MGKKNNNVRVTVNLKDRFSQTLEKLRSQLEWIDNMKVSPTFRIKGTGQVKDLKLSIDSIDEVIETLLKILGTQDVKKVKALIESLSGVENVKVNVDDSEVTKAAAKQKAMTRNQMLRLPQFKDRRGGREFGGLHGMDLDHIGRQVRANNVGFNRRFSIPKFGDGDDTPFPGRGRRGIRIPKFEIPGDPSPFPMRGVDAETGERKRKSGFFDTISSAISPRDRDNDRKAKNRIGAGRGALSLIPSGKMSRQISSIVMAVAASLATAIGGMVTTMGATLGAGLAIGGLGILGFGENAADSLHLATVRMRLFGRELFKVFKPASKQFAPFIDQMFKQLPHKLGGLVGSFQNLDVFMPTLSQVGSGLIDWVDRFLQSMTKLEPIISQLTLRFGGLLGEGLIDLFEWLTIEFYENQDAMLAIMGTVKSVIKLVLKLAQMWAIILTVLRPVIDALYVVADFLNENVPAGVLVTVVAFASLVSILGKLALVMTAVRAIGIGATLQAAIPAIYAAAVAFKALAASSLLAAAGVAAATLGASLVIGYVAHQAVKSAASKGSPGSGSAGSGMGGAGRMRGGGGGTSNYYNTVNITGNPDNSTVQRIKDEYPGMHEQQNNINRRTEK